MVSLLSKNSAYMTKTQLDRQMTRKVEDRSNSTSNNLSSNGITDYSEVSDIGLFVGSEVKLESVQKYTKGTKYNMHRMNCMTDQLDRLWKISTELQQEISRARSSTGVPTENLNHIAKDLQKRVENILNSTFQDGYLFSGTTTVTPAVGSVDNPGATTSGDVTTDYYQGNMEEISFDADSTTKIKVGVNASRKGFAELIYAINLCAYAEPGDLEKLNRANDLCNSASADIVDANTQLKFQIKSLSEADGRLLSEDTNLKVVIEKTGYKTFSEALQDYHDALTSREINNQLIIKNDDVRRLLEILP